MLFKDLFNDNMTWESISRLKLWNKNARTRRTRRRGKSLKEERKISSDFLSFWQYNYWLESGGDDDGGGVWETWKK